jgi:16S rRNA (guanine1207-N2)-methyltransferase
MNDHYFSASPQSSFTRTPVDVSVWGSNLSLVSAGGVFAQGRVDVGTSVLFRQTSGPGAEARHLLDLGTGYGVIGCALATRAPSAHIWAVDVNERALQLAAENAARIGVSDRFTVAVPDAVPTEVRFDEIWSNPPIRIGKPALHTLLQRWLPRMSPYGRAVLVVGKNLGADSLQRWLVLQGYACDRVGSAKGFRVLQITQGAHDAQGTQGTQGTQNCP